MLANSDFLDLLITNFFWNPVALRPDSGSWPHSRGFAIAFHWKHHTR